MKDLSITYARDLEGNLVHIGNATKGERYFCVECKDELMLKISKIPQGQKYYRRPHFSHRKDSQCHPETVLHNQFKRMAAELLVRKLQETSAFNISWQCDECDEMHRYNLLTGVASVKVEYRLSDCQPDIALLTADNTVKAVIEVVVKHKPEDYAVKYYKDNEIILIQIDLRSFDDIDHLEERLQHPTKVAFCLSPVCEICGKRKNTARMRIVDTHCWKCGNKMKMALIDGCAYSYLGPTDFNKNELRLAAKHGVTIKERYSQTVEDSYLANVCNTCNAFIGDFYLHEYVESPYTPINLGYKCFHCIEDAKYRKAEEEHEKEQKREEERIARVMKIRKLRERNEIKPCPECGGILEIKNGPYGAFYGCCNYPACRYTESIELS
jgi:ssDNA-binding Zn-finger/Zn-ribbon topoisomerase 1|nr:MAG TPA: DNA topoisomerase I [Caudoviricetes sp.]